MTTGTADRVPRFLVALVATFVLLLAARAPAQPHATPTDADKAEALSAAARKGDADAVKRLLDAGVDVNTKFRYDRTALSFAADRGNVEVVALLLERGADINARDTFYKATPLTWAVFPAMERTPHHTEVVRLLLNKGGIPAEDLTTALEAADQAKLTDVIALLEDAGAKRKPK